VNWDAVGAIGEIVGAAVVFVTLVYLAVQVRHARSEARRALSQGRGEAIRDLITLQIDDRINRLTLKADEACGGAASAFVEALEGLGLTPEEARLVQWNQIVWWNYYLHMIPRVGELPAIERAQFEVPLHQYGRPGVHRLFYDRYIKAVAHPDALRYIEGVLTRPRPAERGGPDTAAGRAS